MSDDHQDEFNPLALLNDVSTARDDAPTDDTPAPTPATEDAADPAATEEAPASHTGPADTAEDDEADEPATDTTAPTRDAHRLPKMSVYTRRKVTAALIASALVAGGWMLNRHGVPMAAPEPTETAEQALARNATPDPVQIRVARLADGARAHYQATGSYRGLQMEGSGLRYATSASSLAVSLETDHGCVLFALLKGRLAEQTVSGKPTNYLVDRTGVACTDPEMQATQLAFDQQEQQVSDAAQSRAREGIRHAAATAESYALGMWVDNAPSLHGLTGEIGASTRVTANRGTHVEVQYTEPGYCMAATIGVSGTVTDTSRC